MLFEQILNYYLAFIFFCALPVYLIIIAWQEDKKDEN